MRWLGRQKQHQQRIERASVAPRVEALEDRTLMSAGTLDGSFGASGKVLSDFALTGNTAHATALQTIGGATKILVAGSIVSGATVGDVLLMRFNPDGSRDQTFGFQGVVVTDLGGNDEARALVVQPDGRIVVAGSISGADFALVRYEANGLLDVTFGAGGRVATDFGGVDAGRAVALHANGKIVVAGSSSGNFALARYLPNGALDVTFGLNGRVVTDFGSPEEARTVLVQPDGKIVVAGVSFGDFAVVRYLSDGSRDVFFGLGGMVLTDFGGADEANSAVLQPDGKLVVAGLAGVNNGDFALARYHTSGALDLTFGLGGRVTTHVADAERATGLVLQPDGKFVVAGSTTVASTSRSQFAVARYLNNGQLDVQFGVSGLVTTGFNLTGQAEARAIALQPNGKIVAVGDALDTLGTTGRDVALARYEHKSRILAHGANSGGGPHVRVVDAQTGAERLSFMAYDPAFRGGVRVATGDFNGDGFDDIVTGTGPGGSSHVRVFSGSDGKLLREFFAYNSGFTGGISVAVGDVNGDGVVDIITGAGQGGGPHVRVFSGSDGRVLQEFFAFETAFRGGVNVAAGDFNGDGRADIITSASAAAPRVRVYNAVNRAILRDFMAYANNFLGGVSVAAADINNDGLVDIVTGAGAGGGPHVKVFSGAASNSLLRSFFAFDVAFRGGVDVTAVDMNGDGVTEIVTAVHSGGAAHVRAFHGITHTIVREVFAFDATFQGGIFVAGA
jgi:uncharacterized delta-60 repeat protein